MTNREGELRGITLIDWNHIMLVSLMSIALCTMDCSIGLLQMTNVNTFLHSLSDIFFKFTMSSVA